MDQSKGRRQNSLERAQMPHCQGPGFCLKTSTSAQDRAPNARSKVSSPEAHQQSALQYTTQETKPRPYRAQTPQYPLAAIRIRMPQPWPQWSTYASLPSAQDCALNAPSNVSFGINRQAALQLPKPDRKPRQSPQWRYSPTCASQPSAQGRALQPLLAPSKVSFKADHQDALQGNSIYLAT